MQYATVSDISPAGKKVLIRVDFNVPIDEEGNITNDKRIKAALPTVEHVLEKGASQIILLSHLGRPKGEVVDILKMDNVAQKVSELLNQPVTKVDYCVDNTLPNDKIVILENVRFYKQEKENDIQFAKKLASHADIYVDDAFGVMHRSHASVDAITQFLPSVAGLLVEKEIDVLKTILTHPKRPFVSILGGAKVSDKIGVIKRLLDVCDTVLIGGAMAYTFYQALGLHTGSSKIEGDKIFLAKELLNQANRKIVLPSDCIIADAFDNNANKKEVPKEQIDDKWMALDIGSQSIKEFSSILQGAKTVIWNGPLGVFEMENFCKGTKAIAKVLSTLDAITIIGGGDSASAVELLKLDNQMTHISTGGGACLEFIEGKKLPGIQALEESYKKYKSESAFHS